MSNTYKLGDICDISIGRTPSRGNHRFWDSRKETENIWLSIADLGKSDENYFVNDSSEYLTDSGASSFRAVPEGTLLMSFKLTIGRLAFAGRELRTNEAIAALVPKSGKNLDKKFLFYSLMAKNWDQIAGSDVKVKGKTLNKQKISAIEIEVPSLQSQTNVVQKLDAAFEELRTLEAEVLEQEIKTVEFYEVSVMSKFFGKDSPKRALGTALEIERSFSRTKDVPYLGMEDMTSNQLYLARVPEVKQVKSQTFAFNDSHILYGRLRPYLNKVVVPEFSGHCSTEIFPLKVRDGNDRDFFGRLISSRTICEQINETCTGARMPRANMDSVMTLEVPIPEPHDQKRIAGELELLDLEMALYRDNVQAKKDAVAELRTSILKTYLQAVNDAAE
jgi:restriction endonuclease S subunit